MVGQRVFTNSFDPNIILSKTVTFSNPKCLIFISNPPCHNDIFILSNMTEHSNLNSIITIAASSQGNPPSTINFPAPASVPCDKGIKYANLLNNYVMSL